jgi:predicted nucleic acid-binding protein
VSSWAAWRRGGQVLRRLSREGYGGEGLVADVLIAMSARASGVLVVTANGKHFERIAAIERSPLEVVA